MAAPHDGEPATAAPLGIAENIAYPAEQYTSKHHAGPLTRLRLDSGSRRIDGFAQLYADGELLLDPPYQRASCWDLGQRIELIRSWLSETPVPSIIINDRWRGFPRTSDSPATEDCSFAVVDGRQRLETGLMWLNNLFGVPASWWEPGHVETTFETPQGPFVLHSGLTRVAQSLFASLARLDVGEANLGSVQEEAELFLLVNGSGTAQSAADLARAHEVAAGTL